MSLVGIVQEFIDVKLIRGIQEFIDVKIMRGFLEGRFPQRHLLSMVQKSSHRLYIVAGELYAPFYSGEFAKVLEGKIRENPDYRVGIVFNNSTAPSQARRKLAEVNPTLSRVLEMYKRQISMYCAIKRPNFHFIVADDSVMLEEQHRACVRLPGPQLVRVMSVADIGPERAQPAPSS